MKERLVNFLKKPAFYLPALICVALVLSFALLSPSFIHRSRQDTNSTIEDNAPSSNVDDIQAGQTAPDLTPEDDTSDNDSTNNSVAKNTASNDKASSDSTSSHGTDPTPTPAPDPTADPESLSATVAYYSDSQSDTDAEDQNHQRVVDYIMATSANPVFHAGDLMEDGTENSLNRFNAVTTVMLSVKAFYSAHGNNERNSSLYFDNFTYPGNEHYFSVNTGNLHMITLDNYALSVAVGSAQYNWLLSDLQSAASQDRLTGVMFHYPIYGAGGDWKNMIPSMVPLFNTYGVDFVVSGHEHSYQQGVVNGVNYFVCSGQPNIGYMLAKVYSSYLTITSYDANNAFIGSYTISQR